MGLIFRIKIDVRITYVVGTMDEQTLSNITLSGAAIEDSTIDNTVIGATSAAAGTFTDLSVSGDLTVDGVILGRAAIDGAEKTADYTMTDTVDILLADTSSGPVGITLSTAAGNPDRSCTIKLETEGYPLIIAPAGAETINNLGGLQLNAEGSAVRLVSDGMTNWNIVGEVGSFIRRWDPTSTPICLSVEVNVSDLTVSTKKRSSPTTAPLHRQPRHRKTRHSVLGGCHKKGSGDMGILHWGK